LLVKFSQKRHLVLRSVHPSPLSASRGFFDTGHFRQGESTVSTLGCRERVD
jgi:uracil-DNA glycosylase